MKKLSRIAVTTVTSVTLLMAGLPILANGVNADTIDKASQQNGSSETQTFVVPKYNDIKNQNESIQQKLSESIAKSGKITVDNGVKTFEISDDALERAINEAYGTSFSGELVKKHHAGVTRVRYYGNGNFNLYLSKSMLNKIRSASYGAAFGIISGLIGSAAGVPTMGLASGVIAFIAKKLVGAMLGQVNPYKVGRVYKIRNWKYAGWRYQ